MSNVFPLYEVIDGKYYLSKVSHRGLAPCKAACPAGIDVPGYVGLIAEGKYAEALKLIKENNPLPVVCGRVCYHPCESVCSRGQTDECIASTTSMTRPDEHSDMSKAKMDASTELVLAGW